MTRSIDGDGPIRAEAVEIGADDTPTTNLAIPNAAPHRGRALVKRITAAVATMALCAPAGVLGWRVFSTYETTPWTRDGAVRAYTVALVPQVSGRVVDLPLRGYQYVHCGDLLMRINPRSYQDTVDADQALVDQAKADLA